MSLTETSAFHMYSILFNVYLSGCARVVPRVHRDAGGRSRQISERPAAF